MEKNNNTPDWWERDEDAEREQEKSAISELLTKICDLRYSVEELAERAWDLWKLTDNKRTEELADYLHYELTGIATHLADLEEIQEDSDETEIEGVEDWWSELPIDAKADICNIPFPAGDDGGHGDNFYEFTDRTNKWWSARTTEQKNEIYQEHYMDY